MHKDSLRKAPLFRPLADTELQLIQNLIHKREYPKGSLIFIEGEPGEALFIIHSGRVKIFKTAPDGREQILNILKEGSVFAEVVLFDAGGYPASAQALEDSAIGMLKSRDMEAMLDKHPQLSIKLLRIMSGRLRRAQGLVGDLALQDAYGRLAALLLRAACQQPDKRTAEGIELNLTLTRQELASMVGTTRETVARILSRLQREGALKVQRNKITILSQEKLRKWLN